MTVVFKYHCITEFVYLYQATTKLESLFKTHLLSLRCDIKQLLDKATADIKIYSVKTSNIGREFARVGYYLARLNKFDIRHHHIQELFYHPYKTNTLFQIIE